MQYTNRGQGIKTWEWLATGDYLSADFGGKSQFFFVVQQDGNVCWYKGSGPSDNRGHVWCAFTTAPGDGDYCLGLPDDGNLTLFRGTSPKDNKDVVWQLGKSGAKGTYYFVISVWGSNAINPSGKPTLGVFESNPFETMNAPLLWSQQTDWLL
jgi:hypothetical protein